MRDRGQLWAAEVHRNGVKITAIIHNRRLVYYSRYLSLWYQGHINIEVCGLVKAVKCIPKYIKKADNRSTVILDSVPDEINRYLHGQYIGQTEAILHLFEFSALG